MKQSTKQLITVILILSSAEIDENVAKNDNFVRQLNQRLKGKCLVEWRNYHDIGLEITDGALKAFIVSDGRPLSEFKHVYFKSYFRYHEQAEAIAEVLGANQISYIGSELQHYIPAYKLTQLARLSRAKVRIPRTIYLPLEHYPDKYNELHTKLGNTFVFKAIDGSTGEDNYLVKNKQQLVQIVAQNQGRHFIAQTFIQNKSDLRILVVGDSIRLAIERARKDNTSHLNNTSQGASATLMPLQELSEELQAIALNATQLMDRDVAGVDIMLEEKTNLPYVLEVNASPQIASGAFEEEKLDVYADFFRSLSSRNRKRDFIGQVEKVDLPEFGLKSVQARVDTGARTSSIWASHIVDKNGALEFRLFDKGSEFYSGKIIRTKSYAQRLVTNSTGHIENRYTVKLTVLLRGRIVKTTFTLANRSAQAYPILLGRNILRGKFIVDVKLDEPLIKKAKNYKELKSDFDLRKKL